MASTGHTSKHSTRSSTSCAPLISRDGRARRGGDPRRDAGAGPPRRRRRRARSSSATRRSTRSRPRSSARRCRSSRCARRWPTICARWSPRSRSPAWSSGSAIMPRTSPSACRASRISKIRAALAAARNGADRRRDGPRRARRLRRARRRARRRAVCERDAAVDDFYNSIFRALLTYMMENPHNITPATHLLFVAKNLERIGDHATNVAEMVYFAATGEHLADRAKGADTTDIGAGDIEPMAKGTHPARRGRRARSPSCSSAISSARSSTSSSTADGEEALLLARESAARPRHPRLDDRGPVGDRGLPPPAAAAGDRQRADHHADRARRGERPDPRPRDRRRRLCHQAVQPRASWSRGSARCCAGSGPALAGERLQLCRPRDGRGRPQGEARRRAGRARARPSSGCCATSSSIPAGSSRASGCSTRSGATTATSSCAPSTSTSAACARRSTPAAAPTSSAPSARPATRSTPRPPDRLREQIAAPHRLSDRRRGPFLRGSTLCAPPSGASNRRDR